MRVLVTLLMTLAAGAMIAPAQAQQAPTAATSSGDPVKPPVRPLTTEAPTRAGGLLTLDPVALYEGSVWFRRVQATLGRESDVLSTENDKLAADLAQQERDLTDHRGEMTPEDFRAKAADFDDRVVRVRREQEEKALRLNALAEAERTAFFRAAIPVFAKVMADHDAVAILDRQSVFISAEAIDVTDELRDRIDAEIGEGKPQPLPPGMAATEAPADVPAATSAAEAQTGAAPQPAPTPAPQPRPTPGN